MTPPPSVRAYAPTFPLFEATPPGAAPDPRLKPGPVFVASGGLIFFFCQVFFELELIQSHMAQKPVLRVEVGCVSSCL